MSTVQGDTDYRKAVSENPVYFRTKNKWWRTVRAVIAANIDLPEAKWLQAFGLLK